jgi:hypothetical protein
MTVAILLLACAVLAGAVVALAAALRRMRSGVAAELAAVREELRNLDHERSVPSPGLETGGTRPEEPRDEASRRVAPSSTNEDREYVITRLGEEPGPELAPALETRLFADLVLRETVVKAASFAYGVRRGLSPANRNRIWFEMRREVKRARKERKAEERQAIREWRARQRAAVRDRAREDDAA